MSEKACDVCREHLAFDSSIRRSLCIYCYEKMKAKWAAVNLLFPVHLDKCSDEDNDQKCPRCACLIYQKRIGVAMFPKVR